MNRVWKGSCQPSVPFWIIRPPGCHSSFMFSVMQIVTKHIYNTPYYLKTTHNTLHACPRYAQRKIFQCCICIHKLYLVCLFLQNGLWCYERCKISEFIRKRGSSYVEICKSDTYYSQLSYNRLPHVYKAFWYPCFTSFFWTVHLTCAVGIDNEMKTENIDS